MTFFFFFFNDTATTEIYTLSLHDALPILLLLVLVAMYGIIGELSNPGAILPGVVGAIALILVLYMTTILPVNRSEEHTSELQSRSDLVCRLLLEKKKNGTPCDVRP